MKYIRFLSLVLVLALLAGCTTGTPDAPTTSPSAPTETTVPVETTPLVVLPTGPVELETVNNLSRRSFNASPGVAVLDERTAAFLTTEYLKDQGVTVTHLLVLDLYTDTVLAEATLDRALSLPVQSHLPGVLPLFDVMTDECIIYDRNLRTLMTFSCEDSGGVFSADLSAYYCLSAMRVCRVDLTTGESRILDTELTLPAESILDYDMEENILLLEVHTQYYLTDLCIGAVDLDTGALLLLSDEGEHAGFSADGLFLEQTEMVNSSDVISLGWDGSSGRVTGVLLRNDANSSRRIPFTDYLFTLRYDPKNAYNLASCMLYRFDGEVYARCELYDLTDGLEPDKLVSLPDGNLLAVDYNRRGTKICLICTQDLTFTEVSGAEAYELTLVDGEIPETYAQKAQYVEVAEELAEVRALADELEQTYDITILMSNQCDGIIEEMGMNLQATNKAGLKNEASYLKAALKELEQSLKLYPEGFFSQFRNAAGERGILVLLVENITGSLSDENVDTLGVTYDMGDWYPIAVDITTRDLPATYCHEIWHAIENKITDENPSLLSDVKWGELNPAGFSYEGVAAGYYYDTEDTYIDGGCGKKSYFVDTYGKTTPQEDRARLMEYIMTTDFSARHMMEAPALYNKMQMMITAVREVFDDTGWTDVHWERFHN